MGTLVLDPHSDGEWDCDYKTRDKREFLAVVKNSEKCAVFVDESGEAVGKYDMEMAWLATASRKWGHQVFFVVQRAQQISKTVRDQCDNLFIFRVSKDDADILSKEFVNDELLTACQLERYHYIKVGRFESVQRGKITKF